MFKDLKADDRAFIGRRALEHEIADKTSRWAMRGLSSTGRTTIGSTTRPG